MAVAITGVSLVCTMLSAATGSAQAPPSSSARAGRVPAIPLAITPVIAPHRITVTTYDGSGQAVHPDVARIAGGLSGWEYWLVFTPYPRGDRRFENPSLAVSRDGGHFAPAPGITPPLARPPAVRDAYESDPDLHRDPVTGHLVLVHRQVVGKDAALLVQESPDGKHWSTPRVLLRATRSRALSPSVVTLPDGSAAMWFVDAGTRGCTARRSTVRRLVVARDGAVPLAVRRGQSEAVVQLEQPGRVVWHLDVMYVPAAGEYWALYAAFPVGARCDAADLFIARSRDGRRWEHAARPLLARRQFDWAGASLYRSTLWYEEERDLVHLVLSGRSAGNVWSLGTAAYALRDWRKAVGRGASQRATRAGHGH